MIKIRLRKNLLYLLALYICCYTRKIIILIINKVFHLNAPYLFLFMMTLGEIIGGATVYIYQIITLRKKKQVKYFGIELIYNQNQMKSVDGFFKKILLIFFAGFFDFIEFIIAVFYVPRTAKISPTIDTRLGCLSTVVGSLICTYALQFKIGKHHKFSLIILSLCFIITLILELFYKPEDTPFDKFLFAHFLECCYLLNVTFTDCTERYLVDFDFINPFIIIMFEGIFEFIMAILYSININPLNEITKIYEENNTTNFIVLIFLLALYLIFSAALNAYKIYCNAIYSPMARSLTDYFLNPFFNIYYFIWEDDFDKNYFYFFICEIISIIMDFFCCLYNEYISLYCFGLEHDTKDSIAKRAILVEMNPENFNINDDEEEDDNFINNVETKRTIEMS